MTSHAPTRSSRHVWPLRGIFTSMFIAVLAWTTAGARQPAQSPAAKPAEPPIAQEPPFSLDLGFEADAPGDLPEPWFVSTNAWTARLTDEKSHGGKLAAALIPREESNDPFGNLMRFLDGAEYQGRRVRLSAMIRVEGAPGARAQMWLRADLPNRSHGAFDNMHDRPITPVAPSDLADPSKGWKRAVIEAEIESDAVNLAIGFMVFDGAMVYIDSVRIESSGPRRVAVPAQAPDSPRPLTDRGLQNLVAATRLFSYVRFFVPSTEVAGVKAWDHLAVRVIERAEGANDAVELARTLQQEFAPFAPTLSVWAGSPADAPPEPARPEGSTRIAFRRHFGAGSLDSRPGMNVYNSETLYEDAPGGNVPEADLPDGFPGMFYVHTLGGGVSCRIPISMFADQARTLPRAESSPHADLSEPKNLPRLTAGNRATRFAGITICWGIMQHFYPYFDVVETDWDATLPEALTKAAADHNELAFLFTLRELVAKLHDGHGNVSNPAIVATSLLPLSLAWAGADIVIAGKGASVPDEVKIGDSILSIDGRPTEDCYRFLATRISGATEGWKRHIALRTFIVNLPTADAALFRMRRPDGSQYEATIHRQAGKAMGTIEDSTARRPAQGHELAPGIVYFDLNGTPQDVLEKHMKQLETAKGIVFDMRGYPSQAAYALMEHLIDSPALSARWNVPIVTMPDRQKWDWNRRGRWNLTPKQPRLTAKVAFVTDGRAISYAESIMGIVEHYKFGEIVGATTAGTNGNVNPFTLPGGFNVSWTGMKVLKHDGSRHHGVGIRPTVPVEPTAAGIAAGRDEVLERAVQVLMQKLTANPEEREE